METIKFKNFILDRFQIESIHSIENNHSVVVSAATGTGKTLIADYVIDKYLNQGKKIVYTAPIKALSNQKYSDFKKQYGAEKVGILTGDVTINSEAPLLIMTTEIYRNMLLSKDPFVDDIAYVIFDEIHFLGDIERGTVWEESVIFSNDHIRFLCLSATIPNARQFANWIQYIKKHDVDVVVEKKRAVPLSHMFYDTEKGFGTLKQISEWKNLDKYPKYHKEFRNKKKYLQELQNRKKLSHIDLIKTLSSQGKLPCIYFCFSRALTEKKAETLKQKNNYLNSDETLEVKRFVREKLAQTDQSVLTLKTTKLLRDCLGNGIAFHHAGILPVLKEMVEKLFERGLVKVLFATETFAVGINMPAKTVCFDSLEKFDGINFRYLFSKEYFQLAGRAGRRGIDKQGYAVSVIERDMADLERIKNITSSDKDALQSQFKLSFNTVLNLIHSHNEEEQDIILKSSFYSYQQGGKQGISRILKSFEKKRDRLLNLGYITKEGKFYELAEKGIFAMRIYTEEILVTEIFCSDITSELSDEEILLLIGRIVFEEKKNSRFKTKRRNISNGLHKKIVDNRTLYRYFKDKQLYVLETFMMSWYENCEFVELLDLSSMSEGDIVRFIRQVIDLLQQVQHATLDAALRERIRNIIHKIDRDVIAVRF